MNIWRDRKYRSWIIQIVFLLSVLSCIFFFIQNASYNLTNQGIASGFGFLNQTAGFNVATSLIEYNEESTYFDAFLVGFTNTLLVSVISIIIATFLGLFVGISRVSSNWLLSKLAYLYVEFLRNIPLLLQIFFWYFAILRSLPHPKNSYALFDNIFFNIRGLYLPFPNFSFDITWYLYGIFIYVIFFIGYYYITGKVHDRTGEVKAFWSIVIPIFAFMILAIYLMVGLPFTLEYPELKGFNFTGGLLIIPEFLAMVVALSMYTSSFIAEIIRAGILSVNYGQVEAAKSLGLHNGQRLKFIIMPQAMRTIIPPLTNQYLNLTKNSSLSAAIAYPDLVSVFAGTVLNQTGQAIEVVSITMCVYLSLSLLIALIMNIYNKNIALKGL